MHEGEHSLNVLAVTRENKQNSLLQFLILPSLSPRRTLRELTVLEKKERPQTTESRSI